MLNDLMDKIDYETARGQWDRARDLVRAAYGRGELTVTEALKLLSALQRARSLNGKDGNHV